MPGAWITSACVARADTPPAASSRSSSSITSAPHRVNTRIARADQRNILAISGLLKGVAAPIFLSTEREILPRFAIGK